MTLAPTPHPTPVGAEEEGGSIPPGTPSPTLYGRCDACGFSKVPARELHLVCVQASWARDPEWVLICGTCFVG